MYCHRPLCLPGPALLLRNRFQTRRPTAPALLPGHRAARSTDMLLGSAVKDVSLSLRLFPQAQARFSLRQRGARAKRISLHAGIFHHAAETSSGIQLQHHTQPILISQRMLCLPRGDARAKRLSLYAGISHRETGLRQAAEETAEPTLISQRLLCFPRGFQLGANRTSLLLPQQGFGRSLSRQGRKAAGEPVPLGPCFPGLQVCAPVHLAKPI